MTKLIIHNVDVDLIEALRIRAAKHGISEESEHLRILEEVLMAPKKRSLLEVLSRMPEVGEDADFERVQNGSNLGAFD